MSNFDRFTFYCVLVVLNLKHCGPVFNFIMAITFVIRTVEGQSRSVIRSYGCDQLRKETIGGETGVKQLSFQVLPEGCDRGTEVSYMERESSKEQGHSD